MQQCLLTEDNVFASLATLQAMLAKVDFSRVDSFQVADVIAHAAQGVAQVCDSVVNLSKLIARDPDL